MKIETVTSAKLHLYKISFEDNEVGEIDKTVWEHSGYAVGDDISYDEWALLLDRSHSHRAREKALYYLSLRDYGKTELIKKLRSAGIDGDLAAQTVERLADAGLIDDARYATALARDMHERKLYPKRRIAMALRDKGFEREAIEEALENLVEQEEKQALEFLRKKGYNETNDPVKREKALASLARYGFSYAAAKRALSLREDELEEY